MPLSVREVLLVLRAKDQASRVIADVGRSFLSAQGQAAEAARQQIHAGQALLGVGVAMAATGAAGIAFYGSMANAAIEYNRQAALTLTQTDLTMDHIEEIKDIARRVGSNVGAPFKEMQTALYDIFSSTSATLPQAEILLDSFARTAVAGQVSIQDAGRATIAILNAFKIPLEDVNRVQDTMFQLVRKGVGTYGEFATTIGRAIPSAVRADQSIEDLAGMLAFLTRNGLSTAMAASSAARALDAFSNPKVVGRLEKMGIRVRNVDGSFRDISGVITDLAKKTAGMKGPEFADFLQGLFKGAGGTIQARRFFDVALKNPEALAEFTADMKNATGAAGDAYAKMADTVAVKTQLLKNNWEILKTYIGDVVIPIFLKLVEWGTKVVKWFIEMDPHTRKLIVYFSLFASAALIVVGALFALAGVILVFMGTLALLNIELLPFLAVMLLIIGALILLAYFVYKAWQNSEDFRNSIKELWQDLQHLWDVFKEEGWKGAVEYLFNGIKKKFTDGLAEIRRDWDAGWEEFPHALDTGWDIVGPKVDQFLEGVWNKFADWAIDIKWGDIGQTIGVGILKGLWWLISNLWLLIAGIGDWIGDHAEDLLQLGINMAGKLVEGFWQGIKDIPVLGDLLSGVESGLRGILSIGVGNPYAQGTKLSPGEQAVYDQFAAYATYGSAANLGEAGGLVPGYQDTTYNDIHDNVFEVANMDDLLGQMDATSRLNNKAVGNAQPTPPTTPQRTGAMAGPALKGNPGLGPVVHHKAEPLRGPR